ncbi:MAG TPA: hypothetical protein PLL64_02785 [Rhodothermales bacterium]|nr:hypothetical protein [Rhodothermales bacterium]HRR09557.1 hypothetical protein [Rhodothermales bacterium]
MHIISVSKFRFFSGMIWGIFCLLSPKFASAQTPAATFSKQVAERQIAHFKDKMGLNERELEQFLDYYEAYQIAVIRLDRVKKQQYEVLATLIEKNDDLKQVEKLSLELSKFEEKQELARQSLHGHLITAFGTKRFAHYLLAQWEFGKILEQMRNDFIRRQRDIEKPKS